MTNSWEARGRSPDRALGLRECIAIGLGSMVGAGLFTTFAPAAASAGALLLVAVAVSGLVAAVSATSMVRLAARYPGSAGVYVYGRERLGLPWGYLAGWSFVVGRIASCAALALTLGVHLWPDQSKVVAVLTVLIVLALTLQGGLRTPWAVPVLTLVVITLALVFVAVMFLLPPVTADSPPPAPPRSGGVLGVLEAAGLLFFAYVGFGRLAPFGDRVRDHRHTIPRAIAIALTAVAALYLLVALALTVALGAGWVAAREAPLAEAAEISGLPWLGPVLRVAAVLITAAALLTLLSGVSRIVLGMASDRHLPAALSTVEGARREPRRAQAVVAAAVIVLIILVDLRGAIAYSSFLLLGYHAIGNACAWTLDMAPVHRLVAAAGSVTCVVIALLLPWQAVAAGIVTLAFGAFIGWARWTTREDRPT